MEVTILFDDESIVVFKNAISIKHTDKTVEITEIFELVETLNIIQKQLINHLKVITQ